MTGWIRWFGADGKAKFRRFFGIMLPILVTQTAIMGMNFCDTVMSGHAGASQLAGTAIGGWKIVKTMGHRIFKLEPVHGFAAETSAALVISGASVLGAPVSTTHTISACIFGVGSTKRLSAVRWTVAGQLVTAWVLTLPAAATVGFCSYWLLHLIWN